MERVYPGASRNDRMVPPSMTALWSRVVAFFALIAVLALTSCSPESGSGNTPRPPEVRYEEVTSAVYDLVFVAENALGVRTSAGGYSSGRDVFIEYFLSSEPLEPDKAASKLKQQLEALGAESVEAGVIKGSILVDFNRLPLGNCIWQGFIHVYDGHLFGYLKLISSGD
jgi:hypothetical protein